MTPMSRNSPMEIAETVKTDWMPERQALGTPQQQEYHEISHEGDLFKLGCKESSNDDDGVELIKNLSKNLAEELAAAAELSALSRRQPEPPRTPSVMNNNASSNALIISSRTHKAGAVSKVDRISAALLAAARKEMSALEKRVWFPFDDKDYTPAAIPVGDIAQALRDAARREVTRKVPPKPGMSITFCNTALLQEAAVASHQQGKAGIIKRSSPRQPPRNNLRTESNKLRHETPSNVSSNKASSEDPYVVQLLNSGMSHAELMCLPVHQLDPETGKLIRAFSSGNEAQATVSNSKQQHHFIYALMGKYQGKQHVYHGSFWRLEGSKASPVVESSPPPVKEVISRPKRHKTKAKFRKVPKAKAVQKPPPPPPPETLTVAISEKKSEQKPRQSNVRDHHNFTDDPMLAKLLAAGKSRAEILKLPVERLHPETGAVEAAFASGYQAFSSVSNNPRTDVFFFVLAGVPYEGRLRPRMYKNFYWRLKGSKVTPKKKLPLLSFEEHLKNSANNKSNLKPPPSAAACTQKTGGSNLKRPQSSPSVSSMEQPSRKKKAKLGNTPAGSVSNGELSAFSRLPKDATKEATPRLQKSEATRSRESATSRRVRSATLSSLPSAYTGDGKQDRKLDDCTDDPFVANLLAAGKTRKEILNMAVEQLDIETGARVSTFSSGIQALKSVSSNPRIDVFYFVLAGLPKYKGRDQKNARIFKGSFWRLKGSKVTIKDQLPVLSVKDHHLQNTASASNRPLANKSNWPRILTSKKAKRPSLISMSSTEPPRNNKPDSIQDGDELESSDSEHGAGGDDSDSDWEN